MLGKGLSGFLMRAMSVMVSIGGMLITALLLGIVSGEIQACMRACFGQQHLPMVDPQTETACWAAEACSNYSVKCSFAGLAGCRLLLVTC